MSSELYKQRQILPGCVSSLPQTTITAEDASPMEKGAVFVINFSPVLREIINETKYLEQLGFTVPELARNVALQEDKFLR